MPTRVLLNLYQICVSPRVYAYIDACRCLCYLEYVTQYISQSKLHRQLRLCVYSVVYATNQVLRLLAPAGLIFRLACYNERLKYPGYRERSLTKQNTCTNRLLSRLRGLRAVFSGIKCPLQLPSS